MISNQSQIVLTLMTLFSCGVLLSVVLALGLLAVLLMRENKKLQNAGVFAAQLSALHANLVNLRKEHIALDELVSAWMNRQANRSKRAMKKNSESEEGDPPISEETEGGLFSYRQ